jgi:beta-lactamase class A
VYRAVALFEPTRYSAELKFFFQRETPIVKTIVWVALLAASLHAQIGHSNQKALNLKQKALWAKLEAQIDTTDRELDGVAGIAIEDLSSGEKFFLHEDEIFPQASTIKVAVLAELYHQHQQSLKGVAGKAKLTDTYTVQSSDLVADSDIMGGLTSGVSTITNRDLATMVVAVSDNSATNVLIDRLGMNNINALLDSLGLSNTRLRRKMMDLKAASEGRENVSTPREMLSLLEHIYQGKVVGEDLTNDLIKVLSTHKESWIARNLPEGLRVADKTGSLEGVRNDCGIILVPNRPYVLCVMTTYLSRERDGEEAITRISTAAYSLFDRMARASEYGRVVSANDSSH